MADAQDSAILQNIHTLFHVGTVGRWPDRQLLEVFATRGESAEPAFAALVDRHGPMVLRVCLAILRDPHGAEDAFQATFLVLAHKAKSLQVRESLGPWLHGVACRTAACARSASNRRRTHEQRAAARVSPIVEDHAHDDSLLVLHEEIQRLPQRYRDPLVLCYLEGLTHEQAAERLDLPVGTVRTRLSWARDRLRGRLTRRGLAPTVAASLATSSLSARAAVPDTLAVSTVQAAMKIAAGQAAAAVVSASVLGLLEGVLTTMSMLRLKLIAVVLVLVTGGGVLAYQASRGTRDEPSSNETAPAATTSRKPAPLAQATEPPGTLDLDLKIRTLQDKIDELSAELRRIASQQIPAPPSRAADQRDDRVAPKPRAKAFAEALAKPIPMKFVNETPLEEVLKHIKEATRSPEMPNGIPIYVDPVGLNEAEKTMTSPVTMDLENVSLKNTLPLLLSQLGLRYEIKDEELLLITSESSEGTLLDPKEEQTPLWTMQQKAERGELTPEEMKRLIDQLKAISELRKIQLELDRLPRRSLVHPVPSDFQ